MPDPISKHANCRSDSIAVGIFNPWRTARRGPRWPVSFARSCMGFGEQQEGPGSSETATSTGNMTPLSQMAGLEFLLAVFDAFHLHIIKRTT